MISDIVDTLRFGVSSNKYHLQPSNTSHTSVSIESVQKLKNICECSFGSVVITAYTGALRYLCLFKISASIAAFCLKIIAQHEYCAHTTFTLGDSWWMPGAQIYQVQLYVAPLFQFQFAIIQTTNYEIICNSINSKKLFLITYSLSEKFI